MARVLFVCLHNAGRSQMSEALFVREADGRHQAESAGTRPARHVHPEVVEAMRELGVDLGGRTPKHINRDAGDRAVIDRMRNAVEDVHTLVERAQSAHPGRPLVLLGHSMGAAVALAYTIEHEDALDALVLSGALAVLEAASPAQRIVGRLLSIVAPSLGVVAIDSTAVS